MATFTSFEQLDCWKACREVVSWVRTVVKSLPSNEFDMKDNITRAARSTTRNIAEGFGRFHHQENIQFCRISRGSLFEIIDDCFTLLDEKYISREMFEEGRLKIANAIKILNGYISYLQKQKAAQKPVDSSKRNNSMKD